MKTVKLFLLTLLCANVGSAQIQNGSFETGGQTGNALLPNATFWHSPTLGSTDYCLDATHGWCGYCSKPVTNTPFGNRAAAIILELENYDFKEYATNTLSAPLIPGRTYEITFHALFCSNASSLDGGVIPLNQRKVGVCFTDVAPTSANTTDGYFGSITDTFYAANRVMIPSNHDIYDTSLYNSWVPVSLEYTAIGGETFMTIGQFNPGMPASLPGASTLIQLKLDQFTTSEVLPIELISFNANTNSTMQQVELNWSTQSELNNDYFTIERSADLVNWDIIGTLPGSGTTSETKFYRFVDPSPLPNRVNYYRLTQTDFDGTSKVTDIKSVYFRADLALSVHPNPANQFVRVEGIGTVDCDVKWYDFLGRLVRCPVLNRSSQFVLFDTQQLEEGVYTLSFQNTLITDTKRVVIKR